MSLHHCPSCRCEPLGGIEPELTLPAGLWVLVHVLSADLCPYCGSEPFNSDGDHTQDCPTLDTCASTATALPRESWHHERSWLGNERWTSDRWREHLRVWHAAHRPNPIPWVSELVQW